MWKNLIPFPKMIEKVMIVIHTQDGVQTFKSNSITSKNENGLMLMNFLLYYEPRNIRNLIISNNKYKVRHNRYESEIRPFSYC